MGMQELKKMLSQDQSSIVSILENFDFHHINIRNNEIRFARSESGGQNIRISLKNNEWLGVKDFVSGEFTDIFAYIMKEKSANFRDVLKQAKLSLGLGDDWNPQRIKRPFGGIYDQILKKNTNFVKTYPESILDQYEKIGNERWIKDGISLRSQRKFDICFDKKENCIIIPWRSPLGDIIAIKNRINGDPQDGFPKYYYSIGGCVSSSLFGFCQNYDNLINGTIICGESEKFVMQLYSMGYKNAVSIGSNCISAQQASLMLSLNPKKIIWMLDESLPKENTIKNAKTISQFNPMVDVEQYWWNWEDSLNVMPGSKDSPGDLNKNEFEDIMKNEIEKL